MKSRPVLIGNSILAGLQILTAAGGLSDILGADVFFLFGILVAAVQVGFNTYVQGIVVPFSDVAALANSDGNVVAGPASGTTRGTPVDVVRTEQGASTFELIAVCALIGVVFLIAVLFFSPNVGR